MSAYPLELLPLSQKLNIKDWKVLKKCSHMDIFPFCRWMKAGYIVFGSSCHLSLTLPAASVTFQPDGCLQHKNQGCQLKLKTCFSLRIVEIAPDPVNLHILQNGCSCLFPYSSFSRDIVYLISNSFCGMVLLIIVHHFHPLSPHKLRRWLIH